MGGGKVQIRKIITHPLFAAGILVRFLMIALGDSPYVHEAYVPFLQAGVTGFGLDPWETWVGYAGAATWVNPAGAASTVFPYGYAMWLVFLPFAAICAISGLNMEAAYFAPLLCADFALLLMLLRLTGVGLKNMLLIYWLSPIIIIGTYYLGLNDIIPATFLVSSIIIMRKGKYFVAGCLFAAAVSAKLSMLLTLPFFIIFIFQNKSLRRFLFTFACGLLSAIAVLFFPLFFSPAGMDMVFNNPEMHRLYQAYIPLGEQVSIYVIPMFYIVMLYVAWRIRRQSFDLFIALLGISLLGFVLLSAGSPGWFIWSIPFLVYYQAKNSKRTTALVLLFSLAYAAAYLLPPLFNGQISVLLQEYFPAHRFTPDFLLQTVVAALGIILLIHIYRESIQKNHYFRLSKKPFALGIAGDSGAGKDTYVDALEDIIGTHSTTRISGDDYHRWDRHKPMWKAMTHLNPVANDLEHFTDNIVQLVDGSPIVSSHYDHSSGKMSRPHKVPSNDFILISGLHALHLPMLRECYDLSIYLDMDEGLRRYLKLKRDVEDRGHSPAKALADIERRQLDSERFIQPQRAHADLIFSIKPSVDILHNFAEIEKMPALQLHVTSRLDYNIQSLERVLLGVFGLHVDTLLPETGFDSTICIDGDMQSEELAMAASMLCQDTFDFIDFSPRWNSGTLGLMQLITLMHINWSFKRRII